MTKNESKSRTIICEFSGKSFEYKGFGRPPKYHPELAKEAAAAKRKAKAPTKKSRKAEVAATAAEAVA